MVKLIIPSDPRAMTSYTCSPGPYIGLWGFVFFRSPENSRGGVVGEVFSIRGGGGVVGEVFSIRGGEG